MSSRDIKKLNESDADQLFYESFLILRVGDIRRFPKVGNYSSYCRCVKSVRLSSKKKEGEGNRKNGNKYLSWAYVEAANFATRSYPEFQSFYNRKKAKTNGIVAIETLSNKLARASYYVMNEENTGHRIRDLLPAEGD